MLELTRRAALELSQLRLVGNASEAEGVRLIWRADGSFNLDLDAPRDDDDVVVLQNTGPLLIADAQALRHLDGRLLHFRADDERYGSKGCVLLPHRAGQARVA